MKLWNREQFGDTLKKVQGIEAYLNKLEDASTNRQLSSQELVIYKKLLEELWSAAQAHESLLRQKTRARWIREGDCNSRYFHLLMNSNYKNNAVKGVFIEDSWVEEPIRVKEEVRRFFLNRFSEPEQGRPDLNGIKFHGIG